MNEVEQQLNSMMREQDGVLESDLLPSGTGESTSIYGDNKHDMMTWDELATKLEAMI